MGGVAGASLMWGTGASAAAAGSAAMVVAAPAVVIAGIGTLIWSATWDREGV